MHPTVRMNLTGVADGFRSHCLPGHIRMLYRLSYGHHYNVLYRRMESNHLRTGITRPLLAKTYWFNSGSRTPLRCHINQCPGLFSCSDHAALHSTLANELLQYVLLTMQFSQHLCKSFNQIENVFHLFLVWWVARESNPAMSD